VPKFKDYYGVLGVAPRAHARIIEETYWELAHELHKETTHKAVRRLRAINEAYEILSTPHKRMAYDRRREQHVVDEQPEARPGFLQVCMTLLSKPFRPD